MEGGKEEREGRSELEEGRKRERERKKKRKKAGKGGTKELIESIVKVLPTVPSSPYKVTWLNRNNSAK